MLYVSIFVHEAGHVLLGRAVGFVVTSFGLGLAHPWVVIPCVPSLVQVGSTEVAFSKII